MVKADQAGRIRWTIVSMLFIVTAINFAVRSALALAAPSLSHDLGINKLQLGIVFSAFGWSYVAAQLPGGWLLDRYGAVRVYLAAIFLWSLLTAAHGAVVWFTGSAAVTALFVLRFLVGIAEAPALPGNARIVAQWFPARERGTATAIFNSAQYFSTVLFAPLLGWIVARLGWEWEFLAMGVIGIGAGIAWRLFVHDPKDHPRATSAELLMIAEGGALVDAAPAQSAAPPQGDLARKLGVLLRTPTLWGLYLGQFFINTLTYFFITWFPVYLVEDRHMSIVNAGLFATVPAICGFVGGILGGLASDGLLRRGYSLTFARKAPIVAGMLLAFTILGCNYTESNAIVLMFMSLAFLGKGIGALGWAVLADVAPRDSTGLSGGIFNMFGNLSSILTPILIGYILATTGSFQWALVLVAGAAFGAVLCFLFLVGRIERIGGA